MNPEKREKMDKVSITLPHGFVERCHKCGINISGLTQRVLREKLQRYEHAGMMDRKETTDAHYGGNVPW
jgi:post-segregation antitoxin (ccd killing protein)